MICGPLNSLIAKADVILQMNSNEQSIKPITLKNQPFATPDKVCISFIDILKITTMWVFFKF